ncbi:hypothetical protein [Geodermatophilus chilensis]|uniref:hypothetical protein n=1 Tax=Geodermatophilus chilensis TaxID=2035835 RepID=UPI000C25AF42|nr:hypothetical protein [Geodermatophilus chilensis]
MSATAVTTPLDQRLAQVIDRWVYAGGLHGPHDAALRVLADPQVSAALEALPRLAALDQRHQPTAWAGSENSQVCDGCRKAYPCPDRLLLDGETP